NGAGQPPTARTILAAFITWDRAQGGELTGRAVGQLAKQIADLLGQGIAVETICDGLKAWRGSGHHPSTLDSHVNAAMRPPAWSSLTSAREYVNKLRAEEGEPPMTEAELHAEMFPRSHQPAATEGDTR